ncbi:MAG TPA: PEGA domain-containing protein [Candidatus Saccharimonadales bacterium]|nr:PEGA domain-containing protein [Candidatus Saccharimonadales bacterium]
MDYLDPKKQARHRIVLLVGYLLIGCGIVIAALVLLYQAYGFGLGKNGNVIQNGLVFFSSHPSPAGIYVNGKLNKEQTNARVVMQSGIYQILLSREGYRDWQRTIEVDGGDVHHYDYPFLVPKKLTTKKVQTYASAPPLATQSPDRRWLVIGQPGSMTNFNVYDLKRPDKAPTALALPGSILSKASGGESWQLGEWADDNSHVVLQHVYDGKFEYVLVDREAPSKSQNLNTTLSANPSKLTLLDKKYDQYYLYDQPSASLKRASLSAPAAVPVVNRVLAYQAYADDSILYASDDKAPAGKVAIRLKIGDQTYPIRTFPAGTSYLLDLAKYSDELYVAAGAASQGKVYIFKDPPGQLQKLPKQAVVPVQVLRVNNPNYLSFSNSAQFIMVEDGQQFGVYDFENTKGFAYVTTQPLEPPQPHATWMDGNRLAYVSQGKLTIFDYDNANPQTLVPASSSYLPAWSPDYKRLYTLVPGKTAGQTDLTQTLLVTPADQ